MFCLSFTIPANDDNGIKKDNKINRKAITRSLVTWALITIWICLISFGIFAAASPKSIKGLAIQGRGNESRQIKDLGDFYLRERNFTMALAQYQKALEIRPEYTGALVNSAIAYNLSGNPKLGITLMEKALTQNPNQVGTIHFNIGEIYERMGQISKAIENYEIAIDSEMEFEQVLKKLIPLYQKNNQPEQARLAAERLLEAMNDPITPYLNMLRQYANKFLNEPDHLKFFENELKQDLSVDYLDDYDFEIVERLNKSNRDVARTHNIIGFHCYTSGDLDSAIKHFEQSVKIWPGNRDAKVNLSKLRQIKKERTLAAISD